LKSKDNLPLFERCDGAVFKTWAPGQHRIEISLSGGARADMREMIELHAKEVAEADFEMAAKQAVTDSGNVFACRPEQLPKFWQAVASGRGELVYGSRLIYPMEDQAMRFLNLIANKSFSLLFT
jgi:hypothetical protein